MGLVYKSFRKHFVNKQHQIIIIPGYIEQAYRLTMQVELPPGDDLKKFIHCSKATG